MNKNGAVRATALLLLIILLTSLLIGCEREKKITVKNRIYYEFFDTVSTIYDYTGGSEDDFRQVAMHFEDRLEYYHKLFDIYNEYDGINNLATVNRLAGREEVKVDSELIDFLLFAKEMHGKTDGNVNVAMGSVLSIWHKYRTIGVELPPIEELAAAEDHTDINDMIIDREASTVYLADPKMSLDVGAIAKGYAVERIADSLMGYGITSYVLDVGGNLRAIGTKADGSSWKTGVQNPRPEDGKSYVYYLYVEDSSVVTSGDYQRYYTVDGKKYHHIINKDTLMPAEYFSSVTVMVEDSGIADALSTALFNMDYESGVALLNQFEDISVVWVTHDGEVKTYGINE